MVLVSRPLATLLNSTPSLFDQLLDFPALDRLAQRSHVGSSMDNGNVDGSLFSRFRMVGSDSALAGSFVHDRCGACSRAPNP